MMMSELQNTVDWFKQAIPEPTEIHRSIQVGCHLEEVSEMMQATNDNGLANRINHTANKYKSGKDAAYIHELEFVLDKQEFLDSLCDQIVTAIGVGHMFGFDMLGALAEVNRSNFSKFEDGKPVFDANGKITKGKDYTPPNLSGMIGE